MGEQEQFSILSHPNLLDYYLDSPFIIKGRFTYMPNIYFFIYIYTRVYTYAYLPFFSINDSKVEYIKIKMKKSRQSM